MAEDAALERLRAILARPDFQFDASVPWWERLLAFVFEPVLNALARLIRLGIDSASGREGGIGIVVLVLSLGVIAAVVVFLVRSIRLAVLSESRLRAQSSAERREHSDRLWQQAQQLAAEGLWPEATRAMYLSALYALDEHAVLHVQSGLTNREHAVRLGREHPELGQSFADLVRHYDRLRYGHYPITEESFTELRELAAAARAAEPRASGRQPKMRPSAA